MTTKTVILYSRTGIGVVAVTCSPAEAIALGNAVEAGSVAGSVWYTLPGTPFRRVDLSIVGFYAVQ